MSEATAALNLWAPLWAGAIGRACWQGSVAMGLAWILCRLLPRMSGRMQSWVWRLAYLKLLVALLWAAPLELPLLSAPAAPALTAAGLPGLHGDGRAWMERVALPVNRLVQVPANRVDTSAWLFFVWLAGAGWCGVQLVLAWQRSRRLRTTGIVVRDGSLLAHHQALCRRLGVRPEPALLTADDLTCPMLVGLRSPVIVLPIMFPNRFELADLRLMLAHELAHLKRRDLLWAWLPNVGRVLFFFHPLLWLAEQEWRLAQEMACDEQVVLTLGASPVRYGALLLEVIGAVQRDFRSGLLTVGVAGSYATIKRRLLAIRDLRAASSSLHRRTASVHTFTGVLLVIGAVAGIIPWRLTPHAIQEARMAALPEGGSPLSPATSGWGRHESPTVPDAHMQKRHAEQESPRTSSTMPHADQPLGTEYPSSVGAQSAEHGEGDRNHFGTEGVPLKVALVNRLAADRHNPIRKGFSLPLARRLVVGPHKVDRERFLAGRARLEGEPSHAVRATVSIARSPLAAGEDSPASGPSASPVRIAAMPDPAASLDTLMNWKQAHSDDSRQFPTKAAFMRPDKASGVLFLPKPFVVPSALMGWRGSPLSRRSKGLQVSIDSPWDLRDLKKMLMAVKQGQPIDPRAFGELLARARPGDVGDGRALKKMLAQLSQKSERDGAVSGGKQILLDRKLFGDLDKRVEGKQREARDGAIKAQPDSAPVVDFPPDF